MRSWQLTRWTLASLFALQSLPASVAANQILKTSGFSTCLDNSNLTVTTVDIEYDNDNKTVSFNVAGTSTISMNVTAVLNVTAYGKSVYSNSFNPCDAATFVSQLCPVPAGSFSAQGLQPIPAQYASLIPAIAFQVPDIAAQATLEFKTMDNGQEIACITSAVSNGKTLNVPAVSYVAVGVAGAALVMAGISAIGTAAASGSSLGSGAGSATAGTLSPSFIEVFTWFQGIALNGMMSVNHPPIYRSFSKNFGFATGIIPWTQLQTSIDSFRNMTGGNLTDSNFQFLQNATLAYTDGSNSTAILKRSLANLAFSLRDITTTVGSPLNAPTSNSTLSQVEVKVSGIGAFVESLSVPQENTFMTVLLVVAIIVAAIVVSILLLKLVLEGWALFGSFPQSLAGFRKHYWGTMARSIVQLILILYGVWVLYCIFQFTHGDSWAAKALAAVTLGVFTSILVFFTLKIWQAARKSKEAEGDVSLLYDDKKTWIKYSLFYDAYKKNFWWTFIPSIVYMFAKGCVVAAADGHGLAQTIAQLVIEGLMLILLVFARPYERKSGNVINIFIQVVRALSIVCILVFVEELGVSQTTQTITGVVLIAIQSVLTVVLAILIAVNAIIICCKENPHRKRRKEAEKLNRDFDNLTPLDAHNSLLSRGHTKTPSASMLNSTVTHDADTKQSLHSKQESFSSIYSQESIIHGSGLGNGRNPTSFRALTPSAPSSRDGLMQGAVSFAAPLHTSPYCNRQPPQYFNKQPKLPISTGGYGQANIPGYSAYRGMAY